MHIVHRQRWDVTPTCPPQLQRRRKEAVQIQRRLRGKIVTRLSAPLPRYPLVAGADISYDKTRNRLFAAVVVLKVSGVTERQPVNRGWRAGRPPYYEFEIVETATVIDRARFPYVPGLLSFREAPALLKCFRKLRQTPDVVMIDGHGLAHPRRFGIACHVGWLLELPTIGCAKSILCGTYQQLGRRRGATAPLVDHGETVGCALRTRDGVQPVFVSVGHKIDLPSAVEIVLRYAPKFRIPEPTRQAHILVNMLRSSS
ncbi:MAG: endonuclease V [Verrucomicrobiia bacterium]